MKTQTHKTVVPLSFFNYLKFQDALETKINTLNLKLLDFCVSHSGSWFWLYFIHNVGIYFFKGKYGKNLTLFCLEFVCFFWKKSSKKFQFRWTHLGVSFSFRKKVFFLIITFLWPRHGGVIKTAFQRKLLVCFVFYFFFSSSFGTRSKLGHVCESQTK